MRSPRGLCAGVPLNSQSSRQTKSGKRLHASEAAWPLQRVARNTSKCRGRFHENGSGVVLIPCGRPRSWEGNATSQTTRERASASVDRNAFDPSVNGGLDPRRERNRAYMICLAYTIDNRPVVLLPERPRIKTREQAFDLGAVS